MLKFGMALIVTWGKCNIYYYSYYKHYDPQLSFQYNNLSVAILAPPLVLISLISMRIGKIIGFVK